MARALIAGVKCIPSGSGSELGKAGAPDHAHAARGVAHSRRGEEAEQEGEKNVPDAPEQRHPAFLVSAAAKDDVGIARVRWLAQFHEELWVAGTVGIEEGQQLGVGAVSRLP